MLTLLIVVIFLALAFDFVNGFHDAANAIATIVSTRVLSPFQAVLWAATFHFLAYFIFDDHKVANTVAKTVYEQFITLPVILCGLVAAISWNLLTWRLSIPSSSSHTLIGGFVGSGMAHAYFSGSNYLEAINIHTVFLIFSYIFFAPIIGMIIAMFVTFIVNGIYRNKPSNYKSRGLSVMQLVSSAALSFAHGGNDAQKVMGIIYVSLVAGNVLSDGAKMPEWIPLACYAMISLGTMAGGWRIVRTMAVKITKITPIKGVSAETAGAMTLLFTEHFGIPVSTTHTMVGAIAGTGMVKGASTIRWKTMGRLLWAWIATIPVSALLAAVIYSLFIRI